MPTQQTTFTFALDSFQIKDTRARHNDTDFVTFTLLVKPKDGPGTPRSLQKAMGDVNNGLHPVNLAFTDIPVGPTDTVVLNYLIVNSGHSSPSQVESTLANTGITLATSAGTAAGTAIFPGLGSILGAAAGWLAGHLVGILNANCDGPVAAEQDTFTYNDLVAKTAHGSFTHSTHHPGTDSATGCGGNSDYTVNWHMQNVTKPVIRHLPTDMKTDVRVGAMETSRP